MARKPVIYVSSTFVDLEAHRAALKTALEKAQYEVESMEKYPAFDERPLDKCLKDVASSDVYVLLLAHRYGFRPEEGNPERRSITQLEYEEAGRHGGKPDGKPRLVFTVEPDHLWNPKWIDNDEDKRDLASFRAMVENRHGVNRFTDANHLASLVLQALSNLAAPREEHDARSPAREADTERVLQPLLRRLEEVYAYKEVHDVLQRVAIELGMIALRRDEFPNGGTLREVGSHARELRKRLRDLMRNEASGRCDTELMREMIGEYEGAMGTLDQAMQRESREELDQSIGYFESLLARYLAWADASMNARARQLAPDSDAPLAAIEQLRPLFEQLQRGAALHSQCQRVDGQLALIRKLGEHEQFQEIRRQWRSLATLLEKVLLGWSASEVDQLRSSIDRLSSAIAANDEHGARHPFDDLCSMFDLGFYEIDSNLKELCRNVKQTTEAVLRPGPGSS